MPDPVNDKLKIVPSEGKSPSIRWGDGYALIRLARPLASMQPPGQRLILGYEKLIKQPHILVFGERSGGGRDFLAWWCETLEAKDRLWISVQGDRWRNTLFECPQEVRELQEKAEQGCGPCDFIERFGIGTNDVAERAQALTDFARHLEKSNAYFHLIIRDLGGLGQDGAQQAAQALRIAGEHQLTAKRLQIVIVSTSESRFQDQYHASGYAAMCERYRLPWLAADEIKYLAEKSEPAGAPSLVLDEEILDELMVATGGQPLLVQRLLKLLRQNQGAVGAPDCRQVRKCYRALRSSPPEVVEAWKTDLTERLEQRPELEEITRNYVTGDSRGAEQGLPANHFSLMLSGWIRFDLKIERWKISSKLHAHFAQQVLDSR